ncbi:MAG TPA: sigma-70 family RNA polymerase sigma factor, partial [Fimbriiglobus sp.]|nr:sigma-70 family RNA polymerase sigma factor [Fimbriiglobus sp.]
MPLRLRVRPALDDDRLLLARFADTGDQAAFAALVDRHGPLVLGVCRRVLRDQHLADDAFQAAFVVLARKARRVRVGASLASYLFGIARRVALAARRRESRMRNAERGLRNERQVESPQSAVRPAHSPDWDDLLRVLDEELERLPDKLRAPVLECFFREKTQDEAARSLGWSLSTLRRRLDRAKALLRDRLTTRGATLTAGLVAGTFAASTAMAKVSPE